MRQKSVPEKEPATQVVKNIRIDPAKFGLLPMVTPKRTG